MMTKAAKGLVAALLVGAAFGVSACGKKGELQPPEGAPTELSIAR